MTIPTSATSAAQGRSAAPPTAASVLRSLGTADAAPRPLPLRRLPLRPAYGTTGRPAVTDGGSRRRPGRVLTGVCSGIAVHLDASAAVVRAVFVLAAFAGGAGVLLYLLLWLTVPVGDPWAEAAGSVPAIRARLAARPTGPATIPTRLRFLLSGGALLLAAVLVALWRVGVLSLVDWAGPLIVIGCGAALAWSQVDAVTGPARDIGARLRMVGGVALAAVGILMWLGHGIAPRDLLAGALTGAALVVGTGLILTPLWLRTNRALADTRAAEVREAERADIAAHLHDSVLQTLTLIRKRADEPEIVARLARSQERELRAWLYTDRPEEGTSVADAVRDLIGEIEDRYGAEVELVVVGDRVPNRATEVIVAAAREALSNAVRHGEPPVSVYAELSDERMEIFVRDRGPGFDLDAVAPDRHGVRESIIARMVRHGGTAEVRRLARGTEVALRLPTPAPAPAKEHDD